MTTLARDFAIYKLASEWHSGQWSQGYRICCRMGERLRTRFGIARPLDQVRLDRPVFAAEVQHYTNKYQSAFERNG